MGVYFTFYNKTREIWSKDPTNDLNIKYWKNLTEEYDIVEDAAKEIIKFNKWDINDTIYIRGDCLEEEFLYKEQKIYDLHNTEQLNFLLEQDRFIFKDKLVEYLYPTS